MCVVSMVQDQYAPFIPPAPWSPWRPEVVPWEWQSYAPKVVPGIDRVPEPIIDLDKLERLLESYRKALEAAGVFDELTGQPDCVDPEKAKLEERVTELEEQLRKVREAAS